MGALTFSTDRPVDVPAFRDVLERSALAERRPVDDDACLRGMLAHADLVATCWDGDRLVGVARSVTDFHYCCYLSDLAVDAAYQRRGIGTELIALTQARLGPRCRLILLSAPDAVGYYPRLGFEAHPAAFTLPRDRPARAAGPEGIRPPRPDERGSGFR